MAGYPHQQAFNEVQWIRIDSRSLANLSSGYLADMWEYCLDCLDLLKREGSTFLIIKVGNNIMIALMNEPFWCAILQRVSKLNGCIVGKLCIHLLQYL